MKRNWSHSILFISWSQQFIVRSLSILLDADLWMINNMEHLCMSCFCQLRLIRTLWHSTIYCLALQLHSFSDSILSLPICQSSGCTISSFILEVHCLSHSQEARIFAYNGCFTRIWHVVHVNVLHWLPIAKRIVFKNIMLSNEWKRESLLLGSVESVVVWKHEPGRTLMPVGGGTESEPSLSYVPFLHT